jgi:pilus biogenesis lipoprotein CpaD
MNRLLLVLVGLTLGACTLQNPTFVNQEKLQVTKQEVVFERDADRLTRHDLTALADDIKRRGDSTVTIHVLHQPGAAPASIGKRQAMMIRDHLLQEGVTLPIHVHLNSQGTTIPNPIQVTYSAFNASSPCATDITQADGNHYTPTSDVPYQFGCGRDKYVSAMIARPQDLLGNDSSTLAESQRLSKSLETYRAGERATPAGEDGISASSVYGE